MPIAEQFKREIPITFSREESMKLSGINAYVSIDNKQIGMLRDGESIEVSTSAGKHLIVIDSAQREVNRSIGMALFLGTPAHQGGATGSFAKEIIVPESADSIVVEITPNWRERRLEIKYVRVMPE